MTNLLALAGFEQALANLMTAASRVTETPEFPEMFGELTAAETDPANQAFDASPEGPLTSGGGKQLEPAPPKQKGAATVQPAPLLPVAVNMPQIVPPSVAPDSAPAESPTAISQLEMPVRLKPAAHVAFTARLVPIASKGGDVILSEPLPEAPAAETPKTLPAVNPAAQTEPDPEESGAGQAIPIPKTSHLEVAAHAPAESTPVPIKEGDNSKPVEHIEKPEALAEPAHLKPPPIVRDIKLEVTGNDRRVELLLSERAGEVRVAVRTPYSRLAVDLRENLPSLSTRLEQVGFRTETLHTTTAVQSGPLRSLEQPGSSGDSPQDTHSRQEHREQRHDSHHEQTPNRKQKGKEFEWLMSSLR